MGESESARTEQELKELRGQIDTDLALLKERVRADLDVRDLARRRPIPVFGGAAAVGALVLGAVAKRISDGRKRRPVKEIDDLIQRLGGRVDRMKKRQRERLRDSIRKEIGEVEAGTKLERSAWQALTTGLTVLATSLARSSVGRFLAEPPRDEPEREREAAR